MEVLEKLADFVSEEITNNPEAKVIFISNDKDARIDFFLDVFTGLNCNEFNFTTKGHRIYRKNSRHTSFEAKTGSLEESVQGICADFLTIIIDKTVDPKVVDCALGSCANINNHLVRVL